MAITTDQIKELRDRTGISITACKKALEEAGGDMQAAVDLLRKKGEAKAAERADRTTGEGMIAIATDGTKAAMIRVGSETDFVAKNEDFVNTVQGFANTVLEQGADVDLSNEVSDLGLKSGEKIELAETLVYESGTVGTYVHSNNKIGVLVQLEGGDKDLADGIAMHIAATSPKTTTPDEVDEALVEKEKAFWIDELKEQNKPENIWDNIMAGKEKKFREESALVSQQFVKNPDQTVGQLLESAGASITAFMRFGI